MNNLTASHTMISLKGRKSILEETLECSSDPIQKVKIKSELKKIDKKLKKMDLRIY